MSAAPGIVRRVLAGLAAAMVTAAIGAGAFIGYRSVLEQPVARVVYAGELDRLRQADLEALSLAIQQAAPGSVTLESVREAARRVPWVRDASVRRLFPDALEVTLQAHEAFAHWNEDELISTRGEVFAAQDSAALPRLRGPQGSGPAMLAQYRALAAVLAPISPVTELRLSPRGAWMVVLDSGLTLQGGRGDVLARVQRFATAWPRLAADPGDAGFVDLRYPNGFAIRRAAVLTVKPAPK